ncbi:MAG: hypothetical protein J5I98_25575 [Phaeodactylibacter sp.]|nr:hypothetical protein [Phaeodactylibacter sp.]
MEKKNPIDQIIKEKLEGLNLPFDAGSWQLMEQRLDEEAMGKPMEGQPAADTKHIDEAVFEKLHRYRVPYQPGHWRRMEALLEEAFAWPRQVLRYKIAELAVMLLLFLLLWQHAPTGHRSGDTVDLKVLESTPLVVPRNQETTTGNGSKTNPQASVPAGRQPGLPENTETAIQPSANAFSGSGGNGNETTELASAGMAPAARGPLGRNRQRNSSGNLSSQPSSLLVPLSRPYSPLTGPAHPLPQSFRLQPPFLAEPGMLAILPPQEVAYKEIRGIDDAPFIKNKRQAAFRVGMFGSAEYNHITVPSSEEKRLEEDLQRYAMGYGGGLSVGLEMGRFEVETGAIYAARQYPVGLVYVNGSVGSGLQGQRLQASELNIINVPLHVRYSFLRRGGWRAYALAGASLQVAFQRNYYVTEAPQFDFLPMRPPSSPPPPAPSNEEPAIDRIRKSGLGWFEGGTFEENAYLTGNVGLGLERYINSHWSLFVQPTYQHSLQYFRVGLGPNADQINSLSVLFGAKVRVK